MRTIAVLNQKGGVGKTTTVANTAAALAAFGAKVLTIDFDPQAHLTIHLGIEPQSIDSGSYKVLTQSARIESEIMMVRDNLWLLPANIDLVGAESELVSVVGREIILREAIEECQQDFDYCLIDCAPSLGLLTLNALAAAQEVLIPLQPHFLALQGFGKLLQTVEIVNRRINPSLRVNGILLCMFDSRASLPNEVKADIERFLNDARGTNSAWSEAHVLPVLVRRNIKLAEAPSYGKTIFEYESQCNGAQDYQKVAEFIHYKKLLSDESNQPVDIQQNAEQIEALQSELQHEDTEQSKELEAQNIDNQDNPNEIKVEVSQDNEEPEEYYTLSDESEPSDDFEQQQQIEEEQSQPEFQSEYSEPTEETTPENSYVQENTDESEPEKVQGITYSEENEFPPLTDEHEPVNNIEEQVQETTSEINVIQDNFAEPESEPENIHGIDYSQANEFPPLTDEHVPHNKVEEKPQVSQEPEQIQTEYKPEYSEQIQDFASENTNVQDNQDQTKPTYSPPERPNAPTRIPPFRISEIKTRSYRTPEQQPQAKEESNEEIPPQENSGF